MITFDIFCAIQQYKSLGYSQRKAAEALSINRKTINRYWDMPTSEYEKSQSVKERLYLKREEIKSMASTQSPEKIATYLCDKYNINTSARTIRRLLTDWDFENSKKLSNISLYCADCMEILRHISSETIDLVVVDPPYKIVQGGCRVHGEPNEVSGIFNKRTDKINLLNHELSSAVKSGKMFENNEIQFSEWIPEIFRVLKTGTHFYCMTNGRNAKDIWDSAEQAGFQYVNTLIWDKGNATPNRFYMQAAEFILLFRKGEARNINFMGSKNIISIPNIIGKKDHPTEKPVDLMRILIENSSNEGETILDPFMGVGSTGVACVETGRKFIGIEINEDYYKTAYKKIFNK